jgi:hypothetical protein
MNVCTEEVVGFMKDRAHALTDIRGDKMTYWSEGLSCNLLVLHILR